MHPVLSSRVSSLNILSDLHNWHYCMLVSIKCPDENAQLRKIV